jgi:hypothetical protein
MSADQPPTDWDFTKEVKDILHFLFEEDTEEFMRSFRWVLQALDRAGAEYALCGGMATALYGGQALTNVRGIIFDEQSWTRLQRGAASGIRCDQCLGGQWYLVEDSPYQGFLHLSVSFTTALQEMRERRDGLWVVSLPDLISSNLCRWVSSEPREEVVSLIRARSLDETFLQHLPSVVHEYFLECLRQARQQHQGGNVPADTE